MHRFIFIFLTIIASSAQVAQAGQTGSTTKSNGPILTAEEQDRLNTLLLDAAKKGDVVEINRLLDEGAEIDAMEELGNTPLILATSYGNYGAMKALLARFANANAQNDSGDTALILAAQYGFADAISLLVQYGGADINLQDHNGDTALAIAESQGEYDVVDEIARVNAEMNKLINEMAEMNLHKKKRRFNNHVTLTCGDEVFSFNRPNNDEDDDDLPDFSRSSKYPSLTLDW